MMQRIYFCVEDQCGCESRFIEDMNDIAPKGSQHHGHDCQELDGIKASFQTLISFWDDNTLEMMYSEMDNQSIDLKQTCSQMIDNFFVIQKRLIQTHIQSTNEIQLRKLIKAINEKDLEFLKQNQQQYQILRSPDLILQDQKDKLALMRSNISRNYDLVKKNLKEIYSTDLQQYIAILEQTNGDSTFLIKTQQMELTQKQDKINELLQQQEAMNQKNQELNELNGQQELKKDAESQNIRDILANLKTQQKNINEVNMIEDSQKLDRIYQQIFGFISGSEWSKVYKHTSISINGRVAYNNVIGGYNAALIEPQLNLQMLSKVKLKLKQESWCMIQICDLKLLKTKCHSFQDIQLLGGAYSHANNGQLYASDIYGQGKTQKFGFKQDDILELKWNGPLKVFTTSNVSTGQMFEFNCNFNSESEIYFAVSCHGRYSSFEIL